MAQNTYKDIAKTNTAFGGIRVFQIIVNIIKTKLFALFLGPEGMGIQSLLGNAITTLHQFTTFGVFRSAVRDISLSHATDTPENTKKVISVFKSLVIFFGLFGMIICILFAPILSKIVMGSDKFIWAFVIVSLALLFEALTNGIITIFQGLRKVSKLALSSFWGAVVSLIAMTPLIIVWREESIPYAIVVSYLCLLIVYCISYKKNVGKDLFYINTSKDDIREIGYPITKNGTLLMLSFCVHSLLALLTTAIIGHLSGVETVGLYSAAYSCTYGNLIVFTSILTSDYYPRMSALQNEKSERQNVFNRQIEFFVISLTLVTCLFIIFAKVVVYILFSKDFYPIIAISQIMAISLIIKIVWQTCATTLMAAGKNNAYLFYDAIIGNGLFFVLNISAFYFWGLLGMSYSIVISSIIVMFILLRVVKKDTNINLNRKSLLILMASLFILVVLYLSITYLDGMVKILLSAIISTCIVVITIVMLDRRVGIISYILNRFK